MEYKITFNKNILILSDKEKKQKKHFVKYTYTDKESLKNFIFKDCKSYQNEIIIILSEDVLELWKTFKSLFNVRIAAGGMVVNAKEKLLFIKRQGFWDLPKGHAEKGESIEETALREVEEECGLSGLQIVTPLMTSYHTYSLKKNTILKQVHWFVMEYLGNEKGIPQEKEGITKIKWVKKNKLEKIFSNTYPSIKEVVTSYCKMSAL